VVATSGGEKGGGKEGDKVGGKILGEGGAKKVFRKRGGGAKNSMFGIWGLGSGQANWAKVE